MLEYIASHGTHNKIVRYLGGYGADTSWGTTEECLVMELMSSDLGSCIKERTAMQKGLSFAGAMVVMHGVASGLAHLHSIGVTSRPETAEYLDGSQVSRTICWFTRTHPSVPLACGRISNVTLLRVCGYGDMQLQVRVSSYSHVALVML